MTEVGTAHTGRAGPADAGPPAGWRRRDAAGTAALVEDATPTRAVAAAPLATTSGSGEPVLSVVVMLERQPTPDQPAIEPLVRQASVALDVVIGLPDAALAALDTGGGAATRLYARQVRYRLIRRATGPGPHQARRVLAEATASGPLARAGLSAMLERDDALSVLSALRGEGSRLAVTAQVDYDLPSTTRTVRMESSWAEIHDALARCARDRVVDTDGIRAAVRMLLADGRLRVTGVPAGLVDTDTVARAVQAQSVIVLDRHGEGAWTLRARPNPAFRFDYEVSMTVRGAGTLDLAAPLANLLGPPLRGLSLDPFVSLVAGSGGGRLGPVAPRLRVRRDAGEPGAAAPIKMARWAAEDVPLTALAQPRRKPSASAVMIAARSNKPNGDSGPIIPIYEPEPVPVCPPGQESGPVVDDESASSWPDVVDNVQWYAPEAQLMLPAPADPVIGSPFVMRFRRTGVTDDGRPALAGTVTVTVRRTMPADTPARAGVRQPREVSIFTRSATLAIPFIDRNDGQLKHHVLDGVLRDIPGGWTVEVAMLNDWVRLCYRALSAADPQAPPAVLRIDYSFHGLRPSGWIDEGVLFNGNYALIEVAHQVRDPHEPIPPDELHVKPEMLRPVELEVKPDPKRPLFDAKALSVQADDVQVRFRREVGEGRARPRRAIAASSVVAAKPVVAVRPELVADSQPAIGTWVGAHVETLFYRRAEVPVSVPCARYGSFYREAGANSDTAVGCRDELQLGAIRYALFAEEPSLTTERFTVLRLLQQPSRFLVVPSAYGITRHEADEGERSYRPCIVLYAVLDPDNAANNRIVLDASLQPDLAWHERDELMARLRELDPSPHLYLPTEIEGVTAAFEWSIAGASRSVATVVRPGGLLRVTVHVDLADWMLLRLQLQDAGVAGSVTFTYPDGTALRRPLVLDLRRVLGPWDSPPVRVTVSHTTAQVHNPLERGVDVAELVCTGPSGRQRIPVGASLPKGASHDVTVPAATTGALAVVSMPRTDPVVIEESRAFIDQIETNIVFVNLIALSNHGLTRITVDARLRDLPGEQAAQLTDTVTSAEIRFILPLTRYLASRIVEYRVTLHATGGTSTTGSWTAWDLASQGNIVSLTLAPAAAGGN